MSDSFDMTPDGLVARMRTSPGGTVGALAAYLRSSCGHVSVDERTFELGYRFHPPLGDEIPHFLNRRFTTGSTNLAVTLQGGMTSRGDDPFADVTSTSQARTVAAGLSEPTVWSVAITVGAELFSVADIAEASFIARRPDEFRMIAEEMLSIGILKADACALCRELAQHDADGRADDFGDDSLAA